MYRLEDATTYIDIDDYYVSFDSGLPGSNYKMNKIAGDGGIVSGIGSLAGRIAKISRSFLRTKESERLDFINWFNRPPYDAIYLRRTSSNFDGICRVFPAIGGGESFNVRNFNFSKESNFEMFMSSPYFESTTITTTSIAISTTISTSGIVNILGCKVFPTLEMSCTDAITQFACKTAEGYGFQIDYNFSAGETISVSTSDSALLCTVNGVRLDGFFSANSTPFELKNGNNSLYIVADTGSFLIKYYRREL